MAPPPQMCSHLRRLGRKVRSCFVPNAACGLFSRRLVRSEHRWLGASLVALVAAVGAGSRLRPGTSPFQIEYLTTVAGLLWFLTLVGF